MRRVTTKQKRAKRSAASSAHLVFTSEQHRIDREAANRLRGMASMPRVERVVREAFPNADEVSFQGHFSSGKFKRQGEMSFTVENIEVKKQCSWYERRDPRRPGGNPRRQMTAILEVNVALPVGIGLALSEWSKHAPDKVSKFLETVGLEGMRELEKRTGYIPQYLVLHPDSAGTVSFHFGVSPVDSISRKLVGRSAGGKKGRRGLRLLGDAFMSILRHNRFVPIPDLLIGLPTKALEEEMRNDDWELGLAMEKKALEIIEPILPGFTALTKELGEAEAKDWLWRVHGNVVSELEATVAALMDEKDSLRVKLAKLTDERNNLQVRVAALEERSDKIGPSLHNKGGDAH